MKKKKPNTINLIDQYYHIDNGGFTFKLNALNNGDNQYYLDGLEISHDFYGYVSSVLTIHELKSKEGIDILDDLGKKLILAAQKLKDLNKK